MSLYFYVTFYRREIARLSLSSYLDEEARTGALARTNSSQSASWLAERRSRLIKYREQSENSPLPFVNFKAAEEGPTASFIHPFIHPSAA